MVILVTFLSSMPVAFTKAGQSWKSPELTLNATRSPSRSFGLVMPYSFREKMPMGHFGQMPAMAVGNAVLDVVLEEGFLDRVNRVAGRFQQRLAELRHSHPAVIAELRGQGLLLGIKLKPEVSNGEMQSATVAEGLLTVAAGMNVLRLAPPLIITEAEADEAVDLLDRACRRMTPSNAKVAAK